MGTPRQREVNHVASEEVWPVTQSPYFQEGFAVIVEQQFSRRDSILCSFLNCPFPLKKPTDISNDKKGRKRAVERDGSLNGKQVFVGDFFFFLMLKLCL